MDEEKLAELAALMARYQDGEEPAFLELYCRLAPPLRSYLRFVAPPGMEAEDLVQTSFLQLHRARRSYRRGAPVRPWAFAIARHVARMARRSFWRRDRHERVAEFELPDLPRLSEALDITDRIGLTQALKALPAGGREAIWLHHVEGFAFREIAAVQGISETAAKVRAHRAMLRLRQTLGAGGRE